MNNDDYRNLNIYIPTQVCLIDIQTVRNIQSISRENRALYIFLNIKVIFIDLYGIEITITSLDFIAIRLAIFPIR